MILGALKGRYPLEKQDIGADTRLSKSGMVFETESYAVKGLGHLCVLRMKAFLGLMKMETVVLAVKEKDLPLFNLDWVSAAGKETMLAELYDTQLQPLPAEAMARLQALKDRDGDLPGRKKQPRWYDTLLYPCSYDHAGKGLSQRFNAAAEGYVKEFLALAEKAEPCNAEEKGKKIRAFAETLLKEGGPAVDTMTKLFGAEKAGRVILRHMYGTED
jgi:hypothetical protein